MLLLQTTAAILSLFSLATAKWAGAKRATESDITLYVYGGNASGSALFYADGLAYFGSNSSGLNASTITDVVFSLDTSNTSVPWTVSASSTTASLNQTEKFYIIPSSSTINQVGFVSSSSTLPTGAVTTGFAFFGTSVAYAASSSNYELMFWGMPTSFNGTFALYWKGTAATAPDNAFPVTLKTTPPISLEQAVAKP